jgi:hypothetical protein
MLTYTATDSSGNDSNVTRTVNVVDTTAPVIILNGAADMTVAYGSTFNDPGAEVTDNSGEAITASVSGSVDTSTIGDYTLTYSAVDSHSNSATTVTRVVHVTDQTAPVITVTNAEITIEVGTTFTETDALSGVSADDVVDGSVTVSADISAVHSDMIGNYTVTYTATDTAGNRATATATVHVTDTTAPSVALNGNDPDEVEVAQGSSYADPGVTVTDNSGENISAVVTGSVDTTAVGTYMLTYTATDSSGNDSNVTRTVNVVDTTAPIVSVNGDNPLNLLVGDTYTESGASVTDNSGEALTATVESNNVDTSVAGNYEVVYSAVDGSNNEGRATRTVNVTTGNAPEITVIGDNPLTVEVTQTGTYSDPGATAADIEDDTVPVDINISAVNIQQIGTYTVTFTATDSNDNTVQATRTVEVVDTTKPEITLTGANPTFVNQNETYTEEGATVTDNSGEALSVTIDGVVDTSIVGDQIVTYTATDSSNNTETVTRTVTIVDVTPPVITTGGDVTVEVHTPYIDAGATATDAEDGDVSASIVVDSHLVNTDVLGDYNVTYTATDSANNSATETIIVHVVDTTPPEIVIDGDNPLNLLVGDTYNEMGANATDNYDTGLSVTIVSNDVNTSAVGLYHVVYYVADTSGNEANATRLVNVTTGEPPVITLDGPNPYDVEVGTVYSDPGATAEDPEDGPVSVDMNTSELDMNTLGTYTVYFEATDNNGNTAYATRTVNVVDNVNLTANPDSVQPSTLDQVTIHVTDNDYVPSGETIDNVFLRVWDQEQGMYQNVTSYTEEGRGIWTVIGQDVEFSPEDTFGGGQVSVEYQIVDSAGSTSESVIVIEYPEVLVAYDDSNSSTLIEPYSMDLLANDIFTDETQVTIQFAVYDQNGEETFASESITHEGNWTVSNGEALFTPAANFAGGTIWARYRIAEEGRFSIAQIQLEYPIYVRAEYDHIDMTDIISVTYDVMANDTVGAGINAEVYLLDYSTQTPQPVKQMSDQQGEWTVEANQSITFVPDTDFSGSNAHVEYILSDDDGHTSQTGFDIQYPTYLQAEYDRIDGLTDLVPVNMDVLSNDTLPGDYTSVTLLLQGPWDEQTQQNTFVTHYEDQRGVWQVEANQTITFTPNSTFGGGQVWWNYKIIDNDGHESETGIEIVYPLFVEAIYDDTNEADISQSVTYDVLNNDNIGTGITPSVLLVDYNNGQSYTTSLTDNLGSWTVDGNNQITFTPNSEFSGGDAHIEYVVTDGDGHYSQTGFTIHYPISASPVCTVTTLSSVDDVYNTIADEISFTLENGERFFDAEIDTDDYEIDSALYGSSTAVSGLNPMYMIYYREQTRVTSTGDTFVEAEMSNTEVGLSDSNDSWYYDESESANDRGYKYLDEEGESGTYVEETDGSNTLSIPDEDDPENSVPIFSFKVVRNISNSEIDSILGNAGINLTLDDADTAQMQLTKELITEYDWWGPVDQNNYTDFDAFIAVKSHDSNETYFDWNKQLLHSRSGQRIIVFAEGSGGTSGSLVEVNTQDNTILTDNAGSWEIRNITDDEGDTYDILVATPVLCGYEERIFKLDGGTVIQGEIDSKANEIGAEFSFSESLSDKLQEFFIGEAPLDIDPDNETSPEITEVMLSGKVFYTVEDLENGGKHFKRFTVDDTNMIITERDTDIDSNGQVISDLTEQFSYELDNGRIRIEGEGDIKIGLTDGIASNPDSTTGDWYVTIYTWDSMSQETWLVSEPTDYPD